MREDEKFVIESVAAFYSGNWRRGENPPDAYIDIGGRAIAVEISRLTQHVTTDSGTRERLSDDQTAVRLARELDEQLKHLVPDGTTVGIRLYPPILKMRKTKAELARNIISLINGNPSNGTELKLKIFDNDILVYVNQHGDPKFKKISAIIFNPHSSPDILKNATYALEDRIKTKTTKCLTLENKTIWLALLNGYWLADADTYHLAMKEISVPHAFEKIIVISDDGSLTILYERTQG
jgi:hypothetical protein